MKTRKVKSIIYLLIVSFLLTNCKPTKVISSSENAIKMTFEYDNTRSSFFGNDYEKPLTWEFKSVKENYLFKDNVKLNIVDLKNILILEKGKNNIKYKFNNEIYEFKNIKQLNNNYSWTIIGSKSKIKFQAYDKSGSLGKFLDDLEPNKVVTMSAGCPPCIFYGAAVLVAATVDAVCDYRVARDVKKCTDNGKCSIVNTCGATCVECVH